MGSDLVSIHSKQEQDFIVSLITQNTWGIWIGLYFDFSTESWKWTDGTAYNYTNWAPSEPTGSEYCTHFDGFRDYMWNDMPYRTGGFLIH
uniref:C-type lectin domain-containing protein n=1 Tax=Acrobeloides nanus TaxID=290746 RepID=A0A914DPD2_9BILA